MAVILLEDKIGIGIDEPRFLIDAVENEDYGARAILSCNSLANTAYSNWGAFNSVGAATFGVCGVNYNVLPILQNRGFSYSYDVEGFVVATGNAKPVIFGVNNVEVARFNGTGGGLQLAATTISDGARNNGEIWFDGTAFKAKLGGAIKTVTLS